jgi:cytochrome c
MTPRFLTLALAAVSATAILNAQRPNQWNGIYTADQAARGEVLYKERCASCHLEDLSGSMTYPGLVGQQFVSNWNDLDLGQLFTQIRSNMPQDKPGSLTDQQSADLMAFIFQKWEAPAGSAELPGDAEKLKAMQFKARPPAAPAATAP